MSSRTDHLVSFVRNESIRLNLTSISIGRPDSFVDVLSTDPRVKLLYQQQAGVWEGWTVGQHSYMVESGLRDYPVAESWTISDPANSAEISRRELGICIALHDIAKNLNPDYYQQPQDLVLFGLPTDIGNNGTEIKALQHQRTSRVIDYIAPSLPVSNKQIETIEN